jgi:hypothetical protein
MKQADLLRDRNHLPGVRTMVCVALRVSTKVARNFPLAIIRSTSAPWQYALSTIPRVCRTPGAFSFLDHGVCGLQP